MKNPYEDCPKFEICSAPKCPLDPFYGQRVQRLSNEEKCTARKSTRLKIASTYSDTKLPYGGLTGREYSGMIASARVI